MRNGKRLVALITAALMLMTGVAAAQDEAPALEPQVYGTFTDVPDDAYYADAVRWAQSVGITQGTTPTTFSPGLTLNRAQGSVFIWRDAGAPTGSPAGGFTDVPAGAYFEEAVNWMVAEGITTGTTATTFSPELPMTRAMYATLMWRAAGSPTGSPAGGFTDVPAGAYFEEAANWMVAEGITTGVTSTTFGPELAIDRAMAVTFLWRQAGFSHFLLNVFHINDHHSNLQPDDIDMTVGAEEVEIELGGFPRVVGAIDYLRTDNAGENNVTVHAGDAITGTLFYTLFGGEADAALMNHACFDMFAIGNHEFDGGDQALVDFLDWLGEDPDCDTDVISANIRPEAGTPLSPLVSGLAAETDDYIAPYATRQYGDETVAFVGLTIAQKTKVSSQPLETTEFLDEVETAQTVIDDLTTMGYDKIGLVTHIGYQMDLDLASMVTGVDFIVGGDSHSLLGDFPTLGLTGQGPYPTTTTNKGGDMTCVVQAWQYSNVVGHLEVSFDEDGDVVGCGGRAHPMLGDVLDFDADGNGNSPSQAEVDASLAAAGLMTFDSDPAAQATLDAYAEEVDELAAQKIGETTEDLCLARFPYQDEGFGESPVSAGRSELCTPAEVPQGGHIQQSVTDAFLARAFRADIALQNSGGVRVDIPTGDISIADAYELLPFANTLYELEMTGAEIVTALEQGLGNVIDAGGSSGAYPYGAGIRWDVDVSKDPGSRFSNVEVRPKGASTWSPINPTATYIVVANSFMVGGGDGYQVLADVNADGRGVDTFLDYAQSWIDWIVEDQSGTIARPTEFSTQSYLPVPDLP